MWRPLTEKTSGNGMTSHKGIPFFMFFGVVYTPAIAVFLCDCDLQNKMWVECKICEKMWGWGQKYRDLTWLWRKKCGGGVIAGPKDRKKCGGRGVIKIREKSPTQYNNKWINLIQGGIEWCDCTKYIPVAVLTLCDCPSDCVTVQGSLTYTRRGNFR